jgi:glyoxalase family protein
VPPERRGTRSIVRTGLRVAGPDNLAWWLKRFENEGVVHSAILERDARLTLDFEDSEGQRLSLIADEGKGQSHPWAKSPVPAEHQIRGLGPITLSVPQLEPTDSVLKNVLSMRRVREYQIASTAGPGAPGDSPFPPAEIKARAVVQVYEMGSGGAGAELHVAIEPQSATARQGAGGVHHVAFRTTVQDYKAWSQRLAELGLPSSGPVNRYYFQSLYFREPNGILFEIATDEPGFAVDEPMEALGERLALPPFLEARRREIEAGLRPLA